MAFVADLTGLVRENVYQDNNIYNSSFNIEPLVMYRLVHRCLLGDKLIERSGNRVLRARATK